MIAASNNIVTTTRSIGSQDGVAVFIDFENVHKTLGDQPVSQLFQRLKSEGSVMLAQCYGDWGRFSKSKHKLAKAGIQLAELPAGKTGKNSADMQMTVDALEAAFLYPHVTTFVIVSGDRDFVPLVQSLRRLGKEVWAFGPHDGSSIYLKNVCDRFEVLSGEKDKRAPSPTAQRSAPANVAATDKSPKSEPVSHPKRQSQGPQPELSEEVRLLALWGIRASQITKAAVAGTEPNFSTMVTLSQVLASMRKLKPGFSTCDHVQATKRTGIKFAQELEKASLISVIHDGTSCLLKPTELGSQTLQTQPQPDVFQQVLDDILDRHQSRLRIDPPQQEIRVNSPQVSQSVLPSPKSRLFLKPR